METEAQRKAKAAADTLAFQLRARQAGMGTGLCRADGWIVDHDQLSGDYDLDEPVAHSLISQITGRGAPAGPSFRAWQPPAARPGPSLSGAGDWLQDYLFGDAGDNGIGSQMQGATLGAGNILGNTFAAAQAASVANAQVQARAGMDRALQAVRSGASKSVRINEFIEIYNANSGKGRPRPRLRVRGMPMKVIQEATEKTRLAGAWRTQSGGRFSTAWGRPDAAASRAVRAMAGEARWAGSRWGWTGRMPGAGILTFAPSAAIDAANSIHYTVDAQGRKHMSGFDTDKFIIASAKSQSGNALGMLAGMGVAAGAVMILPALAGAPVLLLALGAGIAAQAVWGWSGGADKAGELAGRALGK